MATTGRMPCVLAKRLVPVPPPWSLARRGGAEPVGNGLVRRMGLHFIKPARAMKVAQPSAIARGEIRLSQVVGAEGFDLLT